MVINLIFSYNFPVTKWFKSIKYKELRALYMQLKTDTKILVDIWKYISSTYQIFEEKTCYIWAQLVTISSSKQKTKSFFFFTFFLNLYILFIFIEPTRNFSLSEVSSTRNMYCYVFTFFNLYVYALEQYVRLYFPYMSHNVMRQKQGN